MTEARIDLAITSVAGLQEAAFQRIRATLPEERRRKSDRHRRTPDRHASAAAFALLRHLWERRQPGPLPEVVEGAFGKPRFRGSPDWHFNLSHDDSLAACALARVPVGVDVQSRVPYDEGLFERIAAPGEALLRTELREADDLSPLWTRKEAVVKRTGRGLSTPLREVDTLAEPGVLTLSCEAPSRGGPDFRLSISAEGWGLHQLRAGLRIDWVRP
jgi:phosphopantetheinyl transferase